MTDQILNISSLQDELAQFASERDWDQFHSPKNLSMALIVEVAELIEHFQWLTEGDSESLPADVHAQVTEELADIQIYLIRLADKLNVNIETAIGAKLAVNRRKYPADKVRGSSAKYTVYQDKSKT